MTRCWEKRGCDETMSASCPHAVEGRYTPCVLDCQFAVCHNPQHVMATDLDLILDPTVDRRAAQKMGCRTCGFFLVHGPRMEGPDEPHAPEPLARVYEP